jgi:hypothetical protein
MAQGRPNVVAVAFFVGAWGVGVPAAVIFAFHVQATHGIFGLWLGLTLGYGTITLIAIHALLRTDWEAVVADAKERSRSERRLSETGLDVSEGSVLGRAAQEPLLSEEDVADASRIL